MGAYGIRGSRALSKSPFRVLAAVHRTVMLDVHIAALPTSTVDEITAELENL
jgi:hypothetical protein